MLHRRPFGNFTPVVVAGLALAVGASVPRVARAEEGAYPHLVHALYEMREGKNELKDERFSRSRKETERDLDAATEDIDKALRSARVESKYEGPEKPKEYYREYKNFPHLRQALVELREARKELEEEKKHDWGGRRDQVIGSVKAATNRLEEALKE